MPYVGTMAFYRNLPSTACSLATERRPAINRLPFYSEPGFVPLSSRFRHFTCGIRARNARDIVRTDPCVRGVPGESPALPACDSRPLLATVRVPCADEGRHAGARVQARGLPAAGVHRAEAPAHGPSDPLCYESEHPLCPYFCISTSQSHNLHIKH